MSELTPLQQAVQDYLEAQVKMLDLIEEMEQENETQNIKLDKS